MNWKSELQLRDIVPEQRIEATCRRCGYTHYIDPAEMLARPELRFVYIDELERLTVCKARHCGGPVRLALIHDHATEGFTGGLA